MQRGRALEQVGAGTTATAAEATGATVAGAAAGGATVTGAAATGATATAVVVEAVAGSLISPALKSVVWGGGWVQCDQCERWRKWYGATMPSTDTPFTCALNVFDPGHNQCSIAEEPWEN